MSYLIDGNNLGGVGGGRRGARDARAVVEWLLPWVRARGAGRGRLVVVFDGPPQPDVALHYGPLAVEFAAPSSADEAILDRVRRDPRDWIVVTNDTGLARACRDLGARMEAASTLSQRALEPLVGRTRSPRAPARTADGPDKPAPSGDDQGHWKRIFLEATDRDDESSDGDR